MCEASEGGTDIEDVEPKIDEDYILKPFPNDQFIPDTWQDVLATVDVCVNEVTPTVFCDKEGYDIIPIHMVKVLYEHPDHKEHEKEPTTTNLKPQDLKLMEEISIHDKDLANESS